MKRKMGIMSGAVLMGSAIMMLVGCSTVGSNINEYPKMEGLLVSVVKLKQVYPECPELERLGGSEMQENTKVYYPKKYDGHVPESIHEAMTLIAEYFPKLYLDEEEGLMGGVYSAPLNINGADLESNVIVEGRIFRWYNQLNGVPILGDWFFIETTHDEISRIGIFWHEVKKRGKPKKAVDPKSLDGSIQDIMNGPCYVGKTRLCYKIVNPDDVKVTARPIWEFTVNQGGYGFNHILLFDAITGEFLSKDGKGVELSLSGCSIK